MTEIVYEYTIFHNLEPTQLHRSLGRWPLHITIIPPFYLQGGSEASLPDTLQRVAASHAVHTVVFDQTIRRFHSELSRHDVVTTAVGSEALAGLHGDLLSHLIIDAGIRLKSDEFVYDNYLPHVSLPEGAPLPTDTAVRDICLGRKALVGDGVSKTIISQVNLGM